MITGPDGRPILDAKHQAAIVVIFVVTFLCPATLLVFATIYVRLRAGVSQAWTWKWTNPVLWDFISLGTMLLLTIAWSILVCVQTQSGIGTASRPREFDDFEKEEYAVELLYLLAILSWKGLNGLSNAQIFGLVGERRRKQATVATAIIATAFLAAIFASAFQCDGSKFWSVVGRGRASCFDRTAFWSTLGGIDIASDILIHGLLIPTILNSKMKWDQKQGAVIIIALYVLVYVTTASVRLVFVTRLWNRPDFALTAAKKDIATFSQLVFPMSVLCLGKVSRHLDLESYLLSSIGGPNRRRSSSIAKQCTKLPRHSRDITTHVSGPSTGSRGTESWGTEKIEEVPLRKQMIMNRQSEHANDELELSEHITVQHDIEVQSIHTTNGE
ncbi:hypothetical protein D0867_02492 [Hortaea werneckii]|uniref:Rhodopsin domain-containing protein n=1 Tax=Hortaea werneckii TaxID=91943 RepID=A0A3M7BIK4_HORWE|nr:hypothetical protein D0867_02492 [Hortaea werneckii]RMY39320.1 hypothetical protein D0866_02010 [Hortaea werneckii]